MGELTNNAELKHFADSLYPRPLCTDDFADGVQRRAKSDAMTKRLVGLNQSYRSYIVVDIDDCPSAFRWEERHLPPPSIVAVNPANGHCHYYYRLNTPVCFTKGGRKHPQDFYNAVQARLTALLGGDPQYAGAMAKNPLSSAWKVLTFPRSYDLADFSEWFDIGKNGQPEALQPIGSRNIALFDSLRKWAHKEYRNCSSADALIAAVKQCADALNETLARPLPASEVKATARSVGRGVWVWRRAHPSRTLSVETLAKLQAHALEIKANGKKPTQLALALHSGIAQKTVSKYLKHICR